MKVRTLFPLLLLSITLGIQSYGGNPYAGYGYGRGINKPTFKFIIPRVTERGTRQVKGITVRCYE